MATHAGTGIDALIELALTDGWPLDFPAIDCPVRIVWGTSDQLLPWPRAAERFQRQLHHADWVEVDDAGHALQLDAPLVTAQLVLDWTR